MSINHVVHSEKSSTGWTVDGGLQFYFWIVIRSKITILKLIQIKIYSRFLPDKRR